MVMEVLKAHWHGFSRAFGHEVRVAWRKPVIHWLCWCFPLLLFAVLGSAFSEGTLLHLPVAAVDNDHSNLSRTLIRNLNASSHARITRFNGNLPEAREQLESAGVYALLWVPRNFESDTLAGRQPRVTLYYNALMFGPGFYSTQDFAGLVSAINSQYSPLLASASGKALGGMPQVALMYDSLFNASGSYIYYQQFSATIHLTQLFAVVCMIYVLARSRPLVKQRYFFASLIGKLLPYTLCFTTLLMVQLALLVGIFGARVVGDPLYMLAVAFFYVIAAQSIGLMLFSFTPGIIFAYMFTSILVGVAMSFSGTAMPQLSMPLPARLIADLEPLTHALAAMFDLFLRDIPVAPVMNTCMLLLIYPLIAIIVLRKRLKWRLEQKETLA
ncbi:antibiotic ABC transporter permease [Erwinia sp. OLTSP20]|uniref:ABC transporter permease n=1 Tax=unclassified Erwinia TaxID=2622719 RepID=UPI000C1A6270|nr:MULTISPECIES: ABC transporter permease [unclassified Erwinia]PIJ51016.1 antibiotic ABC transporter permease [Erwinia sp. OAMSP11]PIJ73716.1 antibiotic ABC transporter permease [Erwinia sp. OLSSP12]PIJ83073.1 antibiotic ABC transporter permease [Erwinia sp. OLCASP19]PIJ85671.1 antibiotic ABC transporter permease [Erwinia sp. OLMTSP26]PIJ87679.1 antibiotic ABC transporter permease [Erwinia sp. OLMDSP33]